jgi:hypothetical protein
MKKACISVISSRTRCLKPCLESLWKHYNNKHNYPVYVYYFDDIYDSEDTRADIISTCEQNVIFQRIEYNTPKHIAEEELFYNRKHLWYVYTGRFGPHRKGYLHMCHFMSNAYGYPDTHFHEYEYNISIDDESMFVKDVPYDFPDVISDREDDMGAMKVTRWVKKQPHQGNFDCRVGLWDFIKDYLNKYNLEPKGQFLKDLLTDPEADKNFHFYPMCDSYCIKTKMFQSNEWKQWIDEINASGGIYKYRWGDNDVISLFYHIYYDQFVYDYGTVDEGYHNQGALRHVQDYAPSIKDFGK